MLAALMRYVHDSVCGEDGVFSIHTREGVVRLHVSHAFSPISANHKQDWWSS